MNKRILVIAISVLIVLSAAGFFVGRFLNSKTVKTAKVEVTPTLVPEEPATWEDQSQFSFQYPKNLKLDPHPEDNENYAHVELTDQTHPGSVILWTKDTKYQDVDSYIKGNKITNHMESTLGGSPAVKILNDSDKNNYSIVTIHEGYLYEISVDTKGEKSWDGIFNLIVDSYRFTGEIQAPAADNSNQAPAASEEIYSEEEVIE